MKDNEIEEMMRKVVSADFSKLNNTIEGIDTSWLRKDWQKCIEMGWECAREFD